MAVRTWKDEAVKEMRAAIINAPFDMRLGSWEIPRPGPQEVLVSVGAAGICAGDLCIYLGKNPYATYPQVAGHEIAGLVAALGEEVKDLKPGSRVTVEPFIACGECYPCRIGKRNCCTRLQIVGVHRPGGYAEYVTAPVRNIHLIPEGLSLLTASFAEPVAIAVQACRRARLSDGEYVLVLGCGPIGLALIEVARSCGARVMAADLLLSRLEIATCLGAEVLVADEKLQSTILEQTHGEGATVVIEASGNSKAMEETVDLVAFGGRIVIVGLAEVGRRISFPALDFTRKEMTVLGSRASVNCFPEALELLAKGCIRYPQVATEFDMWDAPQVFARLASNPGSVHKGVLVREGI